MEVIRSADEMKDRAERWRGEGASIGFVPTMGYFHEGHLSLMRAARGENDVVAVSLYVNPSQFGPNEDLDTYPRDLKRDTRLAEETGADLLFCPDTLYAPSHQTWVTVDQIAAPLCGRYRPTHFRGVATIVLKLFNIVRPHRAYFGLKDYQQVRVIETMVADLDLPVRIVRCPLIRDPDGLALSSRNEHLSAEQRRRALVLSRALRAAESAYRDGEREAEKLLSTARAVLDVESAHVHIQYLELLDAWSLTPVEEVTGQVVLAVAAHVGSTRLIDNVLLGDEPSAQP